jgi:hypothetical protein
MLKQGGLNTLCRACFILFFKPSISTDFNHSGELLTLTVPKHQRLTSSVILKLE